MTWDTFIDWLATWNASQGFWTFVQGIGTVLAAVAAIIALWIARSQLSQLNKSNRLLAESNDAMTQSNLALTRPYVVVDFEFRSSIGRSGDITGTNIAVHIENAGRTPAKNLRLKVEPPFPVPDDPGNPGWKPAVEELNKVMNGETVIRSLTNIRALS